MPGLTGSEDTYVGWYQRRYTAAAAATVAALATAPTALASHPKFKAHPMPGGVGVCHTPTNQAR